MKRAFFLSVVSALFVLAGPPARLGAQATVGFRAGLSVATFGDGPADTPYEYREGVSAGVYLDLPISQRVGVQIGVGYAEKGADMTVETVLGTLDWKHPIGYLDIPVLLRFAVAPGSRISPQVLVGPAASWKISCEWTTDVSGSPVELSCDEPENQVRALDLGGVGGLSVKVPLSERIALVGDAVYAFGLRSAELGRDSEKNRAFSVTLGMAFVLP